jgi:hypothetical protein
MHGTNIKITEEIQAVTTETYWQGLSKIWRAGFNPVWTQMVATSSVCYDVTFLTQRTYSCSNFVAISSLVLELLKKCLVR